LLLGVVGRLGLGQDAIEQVVGWVGHGSVLRSRRGDALQLHRAGDEVNLQAIVAEQGRAQQDCVILDDRSVCGDDAAVKREIDEKNVLFGVLPGGQFKLCRPNMNRVEYGEEVYRQLQGAVESGVDDCRPTASRDGQIDEDDAI